MSVSVVCMFETPELEPPPQFQNLDNYARLYAQNIRHAILYALRQLAYTPEVYMIFYACADFKRTLRKFYNTELSHLNEHSSSILHSFKYK